MYWEAWNAPTMTNTLTGSEGDPLTYREAWNAPMMKNAFTGSEGDPLTYREAWNAPVLTNALMGSEGDPLSYQEAMESPEKENWQHAIQEEYKAIIRNNTFEVTEAKAPAEPISSNLVFK